MSRIDELEERVKALEEAAGYSYVDVDEAEAEKAADAILKFCAWEDTEEGEDYWEEVYNRLIKYSEV